MEIAARAMTPADKANFVLTGSPVLMLCNESATPISVNTVTRKPVFFVSGNCPKPFAPAEVVAVKTVVTTPAVVLTVGGSKLHVIPGGAWHEKLTLSANPPEGVTVTVNLADWPAVTVALGGVVPN